MSTADGSPLIDRHPRRSTSPKHACPTCRFELRLVWPSNLLTCDNPTCDQDPLFLLPPEEARR